MKNFYLLSISPEQIYFPNGVRYIVTNDKTVDAWWNQISNTFIIKTDQTAQYHANRVLKALPGLSFLIVKIDLDEYNGYLPQIAWDWIKTHSSTKPNSYKTNPIAPTYGDSLKSSSDHLLNNTNFDFLKAVIERAKKEGVR